MNSTRKGLYVVNLGSDDGSRLTVDGTLIYNNWIDQSWALRPRVLMSLTGNSTLLYDFYENFIGNRVNFNNLIPILSNTLSTNTSQNICPGNMGNAISGDIYGALPAGISLSGTGYQWTYSTTLGGARTNISGASGATFTPNASIAPFNIPGTYYLFRNAIVSSANNIGISPYVATNESNVATIVINVPAPMQPSVITGSTTPCAGTAQTYSVTNVPGVTYTWAFPSGWSQTAGGTSNSVTVTTNGTSGTVSVTPSNSCGNGPARTLAITVITTITNNAFDFTSGNYGTISTTAAENASATLTAPAGKYFMYVNFASYGTPTGTAPNFAISACHATSSQSVTESYLFGLNTATIPATNAVFGDPCVGTVKRLNVQASYATPICYGTSPGLITGTTPTGGNGTYAYLWESSTTSATAGFGNAAGTNNQINYTPPALTQTTWYRRTVNSGGCSNVSAVFQISVNASVSAPTVGTRTHPTCLLAT
ncbi:MAG: hypothetical protein Q8M06_07205, partial [Methanobacteriaceae archaeon]|nr:hypothetical protein [Methanobacteriaceae archaeon]